ncbi:unnamed protein product [Timema podura]|uniref:Recombination activating protein 2 n=1 Tax=Timema podura TaxID=61482 RepID=A0ABN7PPW4_TIMPD|nr:unnamed protein product [Timema podura]
MRCLVRRQGHRELLVIYSLGEGLRMRCLVGRQGHRELLVRYSLGGEATHALSSRTSRPQRAIGRVRLKGEGLRMRCLVGRQGHRELLLECCGVSGPDDYPKDLPTTCCLANNDIPCQHGKHESLVVYQDGCVTKLQHFISYSGDMLGGVAIGVSAVTVSPDRLPRGVRLSSFSHTLRFTKH